MAVLLTACGSGSASGIDARISSFEGYKVTNCRELPSVEEVGKEIGDYGVKAYGCSGGLGVMVEPSGAMSDFDASVTTPPANSLTAADIDARIIDQAKAQYGVVPKSVSCGKSQDVVSGETLLCTITVAGKSPATFDATVHGSVGHFTVVLR